MARKKFNEREYWNRIDDENRHACDMTRDDRDDGKDIYGAKSIVKVEVIIFKEAGDKQRESL